MSESIYRGRVIHLTRHPVTLPNGTALELDVIEHPGAAAVVAYDGERVTLLRQYRYAAGGYIWEIPAGTLEARGDGREPPLECAQRELLEEAGLHAERWTALGDIVTIPSFCTERIYFFLAEGLSEGEASLELDEVVEEVRAVPLAEAMQMVASGEISDAKTIAALCRANLMISGC